MIHENYFFFSLGNEIREVIFGIFHKFSSMRAVLNQIGSEKRKGSLDEIVQTPSFDCVCEQMNTIMNTYFKDEQQKLKVKEILKIP